ncbi:MAG: hypothetical protein WAN40_04740 [Thermoplasmata archaeon]
MPDDIRLRVIDLLRETEERKNRKFRGAPGLRVLEPSQPSPA